MTQNPIADHFRKTDADALVSASVRYGQEALTIKADKIAEAAKILRDELGFDMLIDIVALDWKGKQTPRFELVYLFSAVKKNARAQIRVHLDEANPEVPTITALFKSADWAERECFDMMGIRFRGHPNLKRLLMWTEFMGHPLRKDYPLNHRQPIPVIDEIV